MATVTRMLTATDIQPHFFTTVTDLPVLSFVTRTIDAIENNPANHAAIKLTSIIPKTLCRLLASARLIVNGLESSQRSSKAATTVAVFSMMVVAVKAVLETAEFIIGFWGRSREASHCTSMCYFCLGGRAAASW